VIRSLAVAVVLETLLVVLLVIGTAPRVEEMRGLPVVDVVTLASLTPSESQPAPAPKADAADDSTVPKKSSMSPAKTSPPHKMPSKLPTPPRNIEDIGTPAHSSNTADSSVADHSPPPSSKLSRPVDQPVAGDSLDRGVTLISGDYPTYPKNAANDGIKKDVKVKILINTDGSVQSVTPIDGDDQWGFSKAIRIAVLKWRFQPGVLSGYPTQFYIVKTFRFDPTR